MPCYLFTYHGYGTWLPDHPRGFVRRREGVLAADSQLANHYRLKQGQRTVIFNQQLQQLLISTTLSTSQYLGVDFHGIASESSHIHLLLSWRHDRHWKSISQSLKSRLTRQLSQEIAKRPWFSKGSSRKCVRDRTHFEYLMRYYLPKHRGLVWLAEN